MRIYRHWYTSTCNDTGQHDPLVPLPPVQLTLLLPGAPSAPLGTFRPSGPHRGFQTVVHVPPGTAAGRAAVQDNQATRAFRFTIRSES